MLVLAEGFPWVPVIAALGALVTAIAGCLAAYAGLVKAKNEGHSEGKSQADADCAERLAKARAEAEDIADELHRLRMRRARDR